MKCTPYGCTEVPPIIFGSTFRDVFASTSVYFRTAKDPYSRNKNQGGRGGHGGSLFNHRA